MSNSLLNLKLENIKKLIHRNAKGSIEKVLSKLHPADIAYIFNNLSDIDQKKLWGYIDDRSRVAEVVLQFNDADIVSFFSKADPKLSAEILSDMDSDDVTYVLRLLPDELKNKVTKALNPKELDEVEELLHYPEDSVGSMMNTRYIALPEDMTVKDATKILHKAEDVELIYYLYVIDSEGRLTGVLSLRQLILNAPDKVLSDIMSKEIIYVLDRDSKENVSQMVDKYDLLAIPVIDEHRKLIGIITFDDVIDIIKDEANEDIYRLSGTSQEVFDHEEGSIKSATSRLPWLVITLLGEMFSGFVIAMYQNKIVDFAVLSSFMPVIMAMGGNVGSQSSTIIIRNIALGKADIGKSSTILLKELKVGLMMGLAMAIPVYFLAPLVHAGPHIGIIVAIALFSAMTFAAFSGTFVPILITKLKIDPAIASGPFISTFNDITGLTIYFSVALLLLTFLG